MNPCAFHSPAKGQIQWLINTDLQRLKTEPFRMIQYATALLMNLSLRQSGKDECEKLSSEINILKVLTDLMEHENQYVSTHVNGTLYSILTR